MRKFSELYAHLDATTSLNEKVDLLAGYFRETPPADAAWTLAIFSGRRPKKPFTSTFLKTALLRYLQIDAWVLEECYALVGDQGETFSLLIDTLKPSHKGQDDDAPLVEWMEQRIPALAKASDEQRYDQLSQWWQQLSMREIFVLQKLMGGSLRVGASQSLVIKALAKATGLSIATITQRLTGQWTPSAAFFGQLVAPEGDPGAADPAQPYAFALAYPLDIDLPNLGLVHEWHAEWKWDGIRAQVVRREGQCHIWSRGEDLITNSFPEISGAALHDLPDGTVLDGELLAFREGKPMPFGALQKRIGRKKITAAVQAAVPVHFIAYDLLELDALDLRSRTFAERRAGLMALLANVSPPLALSEHVLASDWQDLRDARIQARERGVEGLMLKRADSPYRAGRKRGDWWKWKVEPLVVDAVLLYAQAGSGRRANLFTDYTFAVWNTDQQLVPVAKAYSGLNQQEILELDRWIRAHTKEKFGPVRSLIAEHVFEIGFEGIQESGRHKSGVALRFPRILRWRKDKRSGDADSLITLRAMLHDPG